MDAAAAYRLTRATSAARRDGRSGSRRSRCSTTLDRASPSRTAARQEVPIQFHTGLGDPDLDLTLVDPAALRVLFSDRFRAAPIVLLAHRLPVRPLARLPRRHVPERVRRHGRVDPVRGRRGDPDLPRAARPRARPASSCSATDASLVPELYWVGARIGRRALARVLDEHIADGAIDERTALDWAERILWRNSERGLRALIAASGASGTGGGPARAVRRLGAAQEQPVERDLALAEQAVPADGDHDDEDHRQDDRGSGRRAASRPRPAASASVEPDDRDRAEDRAADRAHPADHEHRDHPERQVEVEDRRRERRDEVGVQRARPPPRRTRRRTNASSRGSITRIPTGLGGDAVLALGEHVATVRRALDPPHDVDRRAGPTPHVHHRFVYGVTFENVREPRVNASALNSTTRTITRKPSVATRDEVARTGASAPARRARRRR